MLVNGEPSGEGIPQDALPKCWECPKPELDPSSADAALLYSYCINQQRFNVMSGERMGLEMQAVVACLDELCRQGLIQDRARAFRRVWIIDGEVNKAFNASLKKPDSEEQAS
jgi:hypothetical protein